MDKSSIFFMHIPKTGGTSFRHILYDYYKPNEVFPNHETLKSEFSGKYPNVNEFVNLINSSDHTSKIICGHYPYTIIPLLNSNYKAITFIRNPLNRFMSHLGHLQRVNNYDDINEYFNEKWLRILRVQSRFFGFNYQKPNWSQVDKAIADISFIGINEKFDTSIKLFNTIHNTNLQNTKKVNTTRNKLSYDMLDSKNQTELIRKLAQEITIYNKCLMKFNRQIKQHNIKE